MRRLWPAAGGRRGAVGEHYARARSARGPTPWREAAFAVVDLETTGLDPRSDEILSFGVVPVDGGRVRAAGALHRLVRPRRLPAADSILIHGIRPADLSEAPSLADSLDELLRALAGRVPVAHAAWVERRFLAPVLRDRGLRLRGPVLDTEVLGRAWLLQRGGRPPARLELARLADALALPIHRPHHALGDALTTAQVFIAIATHLDRERPQTVRSLSRAGRRVEAAARFDTADASA